jgi:hypothetical protein
MGLLTGRLFRHASCSLVGLAASSGFGIPLFWMDIFQKFMSTLPLVESILRRGEDGRDVKNGMTSFTNFNFF